MENKTNMRVPKRYQSMIKDIWHDSDGYWITLVHGYYSPTTGSHVIHEDTKKGLLSVLRETETEQFDVLNEHGKVINTLSTYAKAVELFRCLWPTMCIVARETGTRLDDIAAGVKRNHLPYKRLEETDGTVRYCIGSTIIIAQEVHCTNGILLNPISGSHKVAGKEQALSPLAVKNFCSYLTQQIRLEQKEV